MLKYTYLTLDILIIQFKPQWKYYNRKEVSKHYVIYKKFWGEQIVYFLFTVIWVTDIKKYEENVNVCA
jgi:hypothetical protein